MERSHRKTSNAKGQKSNAPKSSEQALAGGKDVASAAYDEYLWLLQKRNRLLKRLKTKDEQQVELEKREQGFSLYINGANREFSSTTSRRTRTADEHSSSRKLLVNEFQLDKDTKETNRAKTAPTKLTRKEWKPVGFKIKTEQGEKINVNVPGNITGIYSEDFDEIDDDNSENEASDNSNDEDSGSEVEELSLSFNDVKKLRRSLERDSMIQESIQTVIECESFAERDDDKSEDDEYKQHEGPEHLDVKDLEDSDEQEEIKEELEGSDTSLDLRDSSVVDDIPKLRGSYVIYEDTASKALKFVRPVIDQTKSSRLVVDEPTAEEDTIVLSFSKSSRRQQPLSTTSRKKQESRFVLNSEDVLNAMTSENKQAEICKQSFQKTSAVPKTKTKTSPLKTDGCPPNPITDQTVAMVTKKVRNMNASQQKQLLDLMAKLDPSLSQISNVPGQRSIAFGSPDSQPMSSPNVCSSVKDVDLVNQNEDKQFSPDIIMESSDVAVFPPELETEVDKLPKKPPWLDEIKEKRREKRFKMSTPSNVQSTHLKTPGNWLERADNDKKEDSELSLEDPGIFEPKPRSRPSSGRRSTRNPTPDSSRRTTPRPESGRRSVEQPQEPLEAHEEITRLCVSELSPEENPVEQEKWLEESLNSLSQFKRCHQGRITPSNKIEMNSQGDALDDLLRSERHSEQDLGNPSVVDDFRIPELPRGQRLVTNILSTWGDQYYVGLNGIEVFNSAGKPVQISKITADPSDINILPEYKKDPRVVSNLIDGVNFTRDDMHLWLAPFTEGRNHFIYIEFKEVSTLAMVRIWNYNKSRIHSFRGAKDIEIFLDDCLIFRGEMARASGELGSSETFGDTILFTINEEILEAMASNDQTYEPDLDEDEDLLQTSNNFKRPVTADTGHETESLERPYTCPKERKKPTVESTYPNKVVEEDFTDRNDGCSDNLLGQVLELNLVATWGDMYYVGLTGLQLLGAQGQVIDLAFDMLQASPKDLNDLPEYDDDDRTLDKVIDGVNLTMSDEHMWLIPFTSGENHLLTITLKQLTEVTGLRLWNYNKSAESTYRGVKMILVKLDGRIVGKKDGILIRRGPGHCHFDFAQDVSFLNKQTMPRSERLNTVTNGAGDCELTVKPSGFVFQFQLFGSWGDPYYLGLNGLQLFDEHGKLIQLTQKNITAYPESVNALEGVKDDVRTPSKLIDGCNDTDDGTHMWLAPIFPGLTNLLYVIFDEPTTISMIKLWNYRKTPIRGVRQFSILVDDLLVFNGILPQVPTVARGILPNMEMPVPHAAILFTDDEVIRRKEKSYAINGGGYFESQEVCLMNDKSDFQQGKTSSKDADQALRPKTGVTPRTRR